MSGTAALIVRGVKDGPRGLRRKRGPRIRRRSLTVTGFVSALALALTLASPVGPAQAIEYPTWQDLQNAKANTGAAASQVAEIKQLIANLQVQVQQTQAEAEARAQELQIAQQKFDEAIRRATDLQEQADASKAAADTATRQAGQLAAQLYRTGGTDLSVNLFLDGKKAGEGADELLSKLGNMSRLVELNTGIYEQAQVANNTAQSLGDQAKIAQAERETLRIAAEAALVAAQSAAEAAAAALAESEVKGIELAAQLTFMQDAQTVTTAGYEAGVAERARLAAEEAARVAAEAAKYGGSGGAGAGRGGGYISSSGWAVPASGRFTGQYGPRAVICPNGYCTNPYHYGTDIGTGCSAPIYAAHDGTVVFAGSDGSYGNFIKIDHGGGVMTGYAHIRPGGIFVGYGQRVNAGQNIASAGETGAATGCHLHFEVFIKGGRVNAVPFMVDKGAPLG